MKGANEVIDDAMYMVSDLKAGFISENELLETKALAVADLESDRADAYAFALSLAVLTWLHGSQEPDARAEIDTWMHNGVGEKVWP